VQHITSAYRNAVYIRLPALEYTMYLTILVKHATLCLP